MKKIALCALSLFLLAATAFAEKSSIHSLQIAVPIENYMLTDQDMTQAPFVGFNLNYSKMTTNIEKYVGYSGIFEIGFGYNYGIIKDFEIDEKEFHKKHTDSASMEYILKDKKQDLEFTNVDLLNIKWGWGVAYTPTERIILASHLFLGGDVKMLMSTDRGSPTPLATGRFGQDFSFSYKIGKTFGITTQLDSYFLAGYGGFPYGYKYNKHYHYYSDEWTSEETQDDAIESGIIGIGTDIKFGLCWVF